MNDTKRNWRKYVVTLAILMVLLLLPKGEAQAATANEKKAFTFFTETMGLNPAAACGIMANINAESGFTPDITGGGGSYGICQWLGVRKTRLQNWCSRKGYNYTTLNGQLRFLQYELKTYFPSVNNYLKNVGNTASGAYKAAYYFCYYFEAPANPSSTSAYRGSLAKSTYWKNMGSSAVYLSVSPVGEGMKLTWNGSSKYRYEIKRAASADGTYQVLATAAAGASRTYIDKAVETGKKYYYYIQPINSSGKELGSSNKVSGTMKPSLQNGVCQVSLSGKTYTYNGKTKKPTVTVKYDGTKLKSGTHYTVSYSNNKNAGTATVKVTGKGKYVGAVKLSFTIEKAAQTIKASSVNTVLKGSAVSVKASAKGKISLVSGDASIAVVKKGKLYLKKPGIAKITVKAAEVKNYKAASKTITLTVTPARPVISGASNTQAGSVLLKWKKASGLSGYQVQYVLGTKFTKKTKTVTTAGTDSNELIQKLTKGKTYSFRIRSYVEAEGKRLYSSWSKTKKVKVKK